MGTNSIHEEPKTSAVVAGAPTSIRKCRRSKLTHPRRAENTGCGNGLIHEEPGISAVGKPILAEP